MTIDADMQDVIYSGPGDDTVRGGRDQDVVSNWEGGADDMPPLEVGTRLSSEMAIRMT
jgi:hypothetical protein